MEMFKGLAILCCIILLTNAEAIFRDGGNCGLVFNRGSELPKSNIERDT